VHRTFQQRSPYDLTAVETVTRVVRLSFVMDSASAPILRKGEEANF